MTKQAIIGEFLVGAHRFPTNLYLKTILIGCCYVVRKALFIINVFLAKLQKTHHQSLVLFIF